MTEQVTWFCTTYMHRTIVGLAHLLPVYGFPANYI